MGRSLYTTTERIHDNQLSKKQFPLTKPLSIVSNLETKSKEPTDTDQSSSPVCRWCSGAHFTCDCPSDDRKNAGDCRLHAQGKCKKGRSCRYHHRGKSTLTTSSSGKTENQSGKNSSSNDSSTGNSGTNSSSNDSSTRNSQEPSNETLDANGALVSDSENIRQKPDPDDYSKPQTRVCSYKEFGKTFTIPLDGDNGTLWYQLRGLFLPRRCPVCIKDVKKNWTPQSRQKQSQLTQNGSGYGSMVDPKLSNTTPDQQNVKVFCPGWPVGSPTLHSSERSERAQGGVEGRSPRRNFWVCAVYIGKLCFLKAMISNF